MKPFIAFILLLLSCCSGLIAQEPAALIREGWAELIKDQDTSAIRLFEEARALAEKQHNPAQKADALLHLGMASYGSSSSNGLDYAFKAMDAYAVLAKTDPAAGAIGKARCQLLIGTIKARAGNWPESVQLSREAIKVLKEYKDTSSALGLAYAALGQAYTRVQRRDSAAFYHKAALQERIKHSDYVYLPYSYTKVADLLLEAGDFQTSATYYQRALFLADSMRNQQARVSTLLGNSRWQLKAAKDTAKALNWLAMAKDIANLLTDKTFYVQVMNAQKTLAQQQGDLAKALQIGQEIQDTKDSMLSWEKERITSSLEVQFDVAEKDKQLTLARQEKDIAHLTSYLLFGALGAIVLIATGLVLFLRRIHKRDKQLMQTREELMRLEEAQQKQQEIHLRNELEFKESQLSALTLQMIQKNELLQELREKMEAAAPRGIEMSVQKIISKGLNQDKEWQDFNAHFESINKNFYSRIKQAFPDISPNELKICALIKMNLSIKEMAGVLNISPDSVKTARYRLRKKLQLQTEDNLTDFILNLR